MQTISDQHNTKTLQTAQPSALRAYEDLPDPRGLPFFGNALQLDVPRLHQ